MSLYTINCSHPVKFVNSGFLRDTSHMHIDRRSLEWPEAFVIEDGVLHIEADGIRTAAGKGTVLVHPKGTRQYGYAPSPGQVKYIWLHFDAAITAIAPADARIIALSKLLQKPRDLYGFGDASSSAIVVPGFHKPRKFVELLDIAYLIAENRRFFSNEKDHLIAAFLYMLSADYLEASEKAEGAKPVPAAFLAKEWIDNHLDNPLQFRQVSVGRVASQFKMNPDYLTRIFRKSYGVRISEYIIHRKIEVAHQRLSDGMSVKETAIWAGFSNPRYFAQAFKRVTGLSPSELKRDSVAR